MDPILLFIFAGGVIAGVMNTVAGGGSLITLPLLIFSGLPASVANGTNRVAIVMQNVGAVGSFARRGLTVGRSAWILLIPSLLGAWLGAMLAVDISESALRRIIGVVLLVMLIPLFRRNPPGEGRVEPPVNAISIVSLFAVGVYGGFLQAGVGFLYLALFVGVGRMDLVRANLVKVFLVLVYSILALGVFVSRGQVALGPGIALAAGNMIGGWFGAQLAVDKGERWIRVILVLAIVASAVELTGLRKWLGALIVPD